MAKAPRVQAAVKSALERRKDAARSGLMAVGLLIERRAKQHTPVEYGNLRGSGYTVRDTVDSVRVGFGAAYAAAVHEKKKVHAGKPRRSGIGVYWGPSGEPGYLRNAVIGVRPMAKNIVMSYVSKAR